MGMGLLGCGQDVKVNPVLDARLGAMDRRAKAAALPERLPILDSLLTLYDAAYPDIGGRERMPADTTAATAYARLAYTQWELAKRYEGQGDSVRADTARARALRAYEAGLPRFFLLPDSLRMERLRRVAYMTEIMHPRRGIFWLDDIETEARGRGMLDAAELAAHCKAVLYRRADSLGIEMPPIRPGERSRSAFLLYYIIAVVGILWSAGPWLWLWGRRSVASVKVRHD